MLGAIDRLGVTEELFMPPIRATDDISRSSRSKLVDGTRGGGGTEIIAEGFPAVATSDRANALAPRGHNRDQMEPWTYRNPGHERADLLCSSDLTWGLCSRHAANVRTTPGTNSREAEGPTGGMAPAAPNV